MTNIITTHTRCLFKSTVKDFLDMDENAVLGNIVRSFHGIDQTTTNEAWEGEITIMQRVLRPWKEDDAYVFFEYDIPRLGKRVDVVLLIRGMVFCLEFKVGKRDALQSDMEQVLDYALDLKNFHKFSADKPLVPILVPTKYENAKIDIKPSAYDDMVFNPLIAGEDELQSVIAKVLEVGATEIHDDSWGFN